MLLSFMLASCEMPNKPSDGIGDQDSSSDGTTDNGNIGDSDQDEDDGNEATDSDSCAHSYGNWNIIKPATCKSEGKQSRTCEKCFETVEEIIPRNNDAHTPVTDKGVAASCISVGLTDGSHCSLCNKVLLEQDIIPKSDNHRPVTDKAVAATCKDEGLTEGSHCGLCKKVLVEQTVVPKTEDHTTVTDVAVPATCKNTGLTEGSHCSVCNKVLVEQETVSKLKHVYDQKKTDSEYIRTKATTSASATYYYSCICGSKGTTYFSYGSPISDNSGWTSCNKTVYGIAQTYFYTKANTTSVCGTCKVGYAIRVVSTNGEWYKVSESNAYTNCAAYIKCSDVTDDSSMATFVKVPEEYAVDAYVKNQFTGAYLRNDISGSNASKVGLIAGGYITVASVNRSKTWAAVYYFGTDSEGRTYDGSKLYYCSLEEIEVLGLPDNWP